MCLFSHLFTSATNWYLILIYNYIDIGMSFEIYKILYYGRNIFMNGYEIVTKDLGVWRRMNDGIEVSGSTSETIDLYVFFSFSCSTPHLSVFNYLSSNISFFGIPILNMNNWWLVRKKNSSWSTCLCHLSYSTCMFSFNEMAYLCMLLCWRILLWIIDFVACLSKTCNCRCILSKFLRANAWLALINYIFLLIKFSNIYWQCFAYSI